MVRVIRCAELRDTFLFITDNEVLQFGIYIDELNELLGADRASMNCITSMKPGESKAIEIRITECGA